MSMLTRWLRRPTTPDLLLDKTVEANERCEDLLEAFKLLTALGGHLNQRLEAVLVLSARRSEATMGALVELQNFRRVFADEIRALEGRRAERPAERRLLFHDYMPALMDQLKAQVNRFDLGDPR